MRGRDDARGCSAVVAITPAIARSASRKSALDAMVVESMLASCVVAAGV
jgi:hypothetical protein